MHSPRQSLRFGTEESQGKNGKDQANRTTSFPGEPYLNNKQGENALNWINYTLNTSHAK
jgi:hypothetical protein